MVKLNRYGSVWDRQERIRQNDDKDTIERFLNEFGDRIQNLVAEGQLTPEQYAQLISIVNGNISKGEVSLNDLNKNSVKFDGTWFSSDFLAELNNGSINTTNVLDNSLTGDKYINGSISLPKIHNTFGILPKAIPFIMTPTNTTRAESDNLFLNAGDEIVVSKNDISISVYYLDSSGNLIPSHTQGWIKSFVVEESREHTLRARFDDDSDLRNDIHTFNANVYVLNQNVALKKSEVPAAFESQFETIQGIPKLEFVQGNVNGSDGSFGTVQSIHVSVVHLNLNAGESISLSNPNDFEMAFWSEGRTGFLNGWNTKEYTAQNDELVSFTIRRANLNRLDIEDARTEIIYGSNAEFARKSDIVNIKTDTNNMLNPSRLVWGHEYLYSWYDKLRQNQAVKMTWAGDSTTNNSDMPEEFRRHSLGKKLMTLGGYDESLITTINAGHGAQHTGNWLGGDKDEDKRTPNGFLDEDMQGNPDLYIFGYGFNDGSNSHFPALSWQERIDRFEENLIEGLERIRGNEYNRSADEMAIILCTPIAAYDPGRGNTPQVWNDKIRPIIQKACRDYNCAFVDITARQYDHEFSSTWSTNGDMVHPTATANADYMSMFEDLIMPRLFHK